MLKRWPLPSREDTWVTSDFHRDTWRICGLLGSLLENRSLRPCKAGLPLVRCHSGMKSSPLSLTRDGGCKNPKNSSKRGQAQCCSSLCQSGPHGRSQDNCGSRLCESIGSGRRTAVAVFFLQTMYYTLLIPPTAITKKYAWASLLMDSSF